MDEQVEKSPIHEFDLVLMVVFSIHKVFTYDHT